MDGFRNDGYGDPDRVQRITILCLDCGWHGDAEAWMIHSRMEDHLFYVARPLRNVFAVYGVGDDRLVWQADTSDSVDREKDIDDNGGVKIRPRILMGLWLKEHWRLIAWLALVLIWIGLAIAVYHLLTTPLEQYVDIRS